MSKNGLILTSLVGAVPGALMATLMVMSFAKYAGGPSVLHKILCALALLIGLLLAAMPVGIFVLAGPKAEKAPAKKKEEKTAKDADEASGEIAEAEEAEAEETLIGESDDLVEENASATDDNLEIEEGPPDEFAVTGEIVTDEAAAEAEEFVVEGDLEVEEADEGDAPKKKKK